MHKHILKEIHGSEAGFAHIDADIAHELAEANLVELNTDMIDDEGNVAARLTPSGIWEANKADEVVPAKKKERKMARQAEPVAEVTAPTSEFAITKGGFEAPERKIGDRATKYPFDSLEVGDSFMVAGKTAKQFASSVTATNKKYSETGDETETYSYKGETRVRPVRTLTRKFAVKDVDGGVQVGRVA